MLSKTVDNERGAMVVKKWICARVGRWTLGMLLAVAWLTPGARASTPPEAGAEAPAVTGKAACTPSSTAFCLNQGRFRVSVNWRKANGETGVGTRVASSSSDSGLFWFFGPTNYEVMVKVLDGCGVNGRHWVFFLATTNVGFTLTVTDTQTQQVKTYVNPPGTVSPVITDTSAFPTCP